MAVDLRVASSRRSAPARPTATNYGERGAFQITAPPPLPPLMQTAARRRSQPAGRIAAPRWALEAAAAVVLLVVMAAVFAPAAPRPTPATGTRPALLWADRNSRTLTSLARDIALAQEALTTGQETAGPPKASSPVPVAVARLRDGLSSFRSQPGPPDPHLHTAWLTVLSDASAAVMLLSPGPPPTSASAATARADLEAAGEALVAVIQGARSQGVAYPH